MEPTERLEEDSPDIQELISRWAGESKRLLIALPGVLARLEDLQEEADRLRQRLGELEHENDALRQSREELAETFAKLKALIAGPLGIDAVTDLHTPRSRPAPEPASAGPSKPPAPSIPPPAASQPAPVRHVATPESAEPHPRSAVREDRPAKPEESTPPPTSVRFSSVFRPPTRS